MGDYSAPFNGDSSVVYQYTQPGTYWIKLIVSNGYCTDSSIVGIYVTQGIFIPNVFTPNGDGQNDVFHVTVDGMKQYHIEIFNRWGERIFQTDSPDIDWDGTSTGGIKESDGNYYYILTATDYKGVNYKYQGYIQLIRN
jgi:gliding motility-associated-like protein